MTSGVYVKTKEYRRNMSRVMSRVMNSLETKRKCRESKLGKKLSKEHKRKIGEFRKGKNYEEIYGIDRAEEERKKRSIANTGKKFPKDKYPNYSMGGKKHSEETKRKMSAIKQDVNINDWKRFSREPYDQKWTNRFRRLIRKRDNQICMLCYTHREKLNKALCIHHINYDKELTIPQNCISLCNSCHSKTIVHRKQWTKFFQSLLAERYGYIYCEDKIEVRIDNGKSNQI